MIGVGGVLCGMQSGFKNRCFAYRCFLSLLFGAELFSGFVISVYICSLLCHLLGNIVEMQLFFAIRQYTPDEQKSQISGSFCSIHVDVTSLFYTGQQI
ncbi:hypothetical protein QVD17_38279 [Tagetes erecta]|uniref:Uncharacterized protein n=1 Tax=Tagetes erecta TaxID=13708 RepID=A0AAD8JXS7_TARER|nr:hypothetical protein QVD17_38279 [Tagetes erecta]